MKVFISWSGVTSRSVAEALRDWLPNVIQGIEPFVSSKDIDKGANWSLELLRELSDTDFGIICLTRENLSSPWLNYEAGAIMKAISSRAAPVLFGVEKKDVRPPMSQLQLTSVNEDDFKKLMASMNKSMERPINDQRLEESVSVWWPSLAERVGNIKFPAVDENEIQSASFEPDKPRVDLIDKVDEVLRIVDRVERRLRILDKKTPEVFDKNGHEISDGEFGVVLKPMEHHPPNLRVKRSGPDLVAHFLEEVLEKVFAGKMCHARIAMVGADKIKVTIKEPLSKEDLKNLLDEIQSISVVADSRIQLVIPGGCYEFSNGKILYPES